MVIVKIDLQNFFYRANRVIILLLLLAVNVKISWSLALNCTYTMQHFNPIGSIYTCDAGILSDGSEIVSAIYGNHQDGKTDADVHGFVLHSQGLAFIPLNVETFFPNIRALDVYNNFITNITNFHLKPFINLVHFAIIDNQITSLDTDVFDGLPFLNYVSFRNNSIRHVGHDVILPSLGQIHFDLNECIDQIALNATQIDNLKFDLLLKCPPKISQIEHTLEGRPNMLTNVNSEVKGLEQRVAALENAIKLIMGSKHSKGRTETY